MRLIELREGALELQWTWLPYWIACQPGVRSAVEKALQSAVDPGTEPDLDALSALAVADLKRLFPAAAPVLDAIAAATC